MADRIGLLAFWKNYDRKLYLKAAMLADELGYDSFWVPEGWAYEAFGLLTEMAVHTKRIKLCTGIVNVFSRSPAILAMHAATLDEISEGRFVLGIGTSAPKVIEGLHGRAYGKPLTQLRDVIRVVRCLLSGGRLHQAGAELWDYRPFNLEMTPVRSRIPIYVAALKEKSIRSIGELADGWMPTFWPYTEMERGQRWIAEGAKAAGRDPKEIDVAPFTTVLPMGKGAGEVQAKQIIAFYIGGMGENYKELLSGFGFADDCERIEQLYKDKATRSQAADAVPDRMMEALTIAGDPMWCLSELKRRRDYGIDLPILSLPTRMPWEIHEMFIRGMAPR